MTGDQSAVKSKMAIVHLKLFLDPSCVGYKTIYESFPDNGEEGEK